MFKIESKEEHSLFCVYLVCLIPNNEDLDPQAPKIIKQDKHKINGCSSLDSISNNQEIL